MITPVTILTSPPTGVEVLTMTIEETLVMTNDDISMMARLMMHDDNTNLSAHRC